MPPAAPEEQAPPAAQAEGGYSGPGTGSNPAAMLETLPSDLLENPLIFAVAKGQPAAVSAPDKSSDPAVKMVVKHAQPLVAAGFGIYRSIDKKTAVLFNTQVLHPGDLEEADRQGKLQEVAPSFDTVGQGAAQAPVAPVAPGQGAPMVPGATPESQPATSVQNKLASIRGKNLSGGTPTTGPAPGAGNILNSILRPVV
jgi:hypothetical protein